MDKTVVVNKKAIDKEMIKDVLKRVGIGTVIAGIGFVSYKVGYKKAVTRCDKILDYVISDNPNIAESFAEAWDNSINKILKK